MASCFCLKNKISRKEAKSRASKRQSFSLPPETTRQAKKDDQSSQECIYSLAKKGKATELKRLMEALTEAEVNKQLEWKDEMNRTPLIVATRESHADCMQLLLEKGANVMYMSKNRDEGTALHIAVRKRLPSRIIYALLTKGANPFVENTAQITAWDLARQSTNWTAISIFSDLSLFKRTLPIQFGGGNSLTCTADICIIPRYELNSLTQRLRRIGRTLHICSIGHSEDHSDIDLHGAHADWIAEGTPDIASILLTFPATNARLAKELATHINTTSSVMHIWIPRWSSWSLHDFYEIVNQKDDVKAIHRLIRGDNSPDIDGRVWKWIRQQTASQCLEDLETVSSDQHLPDEVFKMSKTGDHESLREILGELSGFDKVHALSWEDVNGITPLMAAARNGHAECVRLLLQHGANVHHCSQGGNGGTALHLAIANNAPNEVIELLLSHHANPLVENSYRVTAADLSGGDRSLMTHEEMLFQDVMKGSISLKGQSGSLASCTDFLVLIAPRYARCDRPQDLRRISKTLHLYLAEHDEPLMEIDLYAAKAELLFQTSSEDQEVTLRFPGNAILTWNWNESNRPDDAQIACLQMSFDSTIDTCSRLVKVVNIQDGLHIASSIKSIWSESRRVKSSAASTPIAASQQHDGTGPSMSTELWEDNASESVAHSRAEIAEQTEESEGVIQTYTICLDDDGLSGFLLDKRVEMHECHMDISKADIGDVSDINDLMSVERKLNQI